MSAVSVPNGDELLRMLASTAEIAAENSTPLDPPVARGASDLETLIRLIVREELQRHVRSHALDSSHADRIDADGALTPALSGNAPAAAPNAEVMCAEDVAAFLGVDRNTVYDYAGRGTIPCRRLGKRLLFHRPALVTWLDPCKAASTRKA